MRTRAEAFELVRALDKDAHVFVALRNPDDGGWREGEREALTQLRLFDVRQPQAVLLAAYNRFADDDRDAFGRFLNAIVAVSFRYNVIGRR